MLHERKINRNSSKFVAFLAGCHGEHELPFLLLFLFHLDTGISKKLDVTSRLHFTMEELQTSKIETYLVLKHNRRIRVLGWSSDFF